MILTLEDYVSYYKTKGRLVTGQQPKKTLNEKQLLTYFQRYQRSEETKKKHRDEKLERPDPDDQLRQDCWARDGECQYVKLLEEFDTGALKTLQEKAGPLLEKVDVAHVFGKGSHPWMRHDPLNVVLLNRYSHSMIDQGCHPLTGEAITPELKKLFWTMLFDLQGDGQERWNYLEERARTRH
jgi:hypothetical protein